MQTPRERRIKVSNDEIIKGKTSNKTEDKVQDVDARDDCGFIGLRQFLQAGGSTCLDGVASLRHHPEAAGTAVGRSHKEAFSWRRQEA